MKRKMLKLLEENIGEIIFLGGTLGNKREVLEVVKIEKNILHINDEIIDLNEYKYIKFLQENILILHRGYGMNILISL